jgi:NAD-dependent SIR2 family protein deacetylase
MDRDSFSLAAEKINTAHAIIVTAGAGMGVDSGLPDFRGDEGFWNAYPAFKNLGLSFSDLANPQWFENDPALAWGFYGHRLNLYRKTVPHAGFDVLKRFINRAPLGGFVFTSNVDGAFQTAGFNPERVVECHGSIHHVQCTNSCGLDVLSADDVSVDVDEDTFRATGPLPRCRKCGGLLRPNILMFNDVAWNYNRSDEQEKRFNSWIQDVERRMARVVIIECGAGVTVPSVRAAGERLLRSLNSTLIRVNTRESDGPEGSIPISMGARAALVELEIQART